VVGLVRVRAVVGQLCPPEAVVARLAVSFRIKRLVRVLACIHGLRLSFLSLLLLWLVFLVFL